MNQRFFRVSVLGLIIGLLSIPAFAQQVQRAPFDVTNYRMDVQFNPSLNQLQTIADVTFAPLQNTRSVTFELNGSLKVESIARVSANTPITPAPIAAAPRGKTPAAPITTSVQPQVTFVQ